MMDDWELILRYIQLVIESSNLPKWGHYELINDDLSDNKKREKNRRF